jgi:DNA repair protein RecN (Recombination protein N)
VLSGLSSHLVDIHYQHQSLLLTDRAFQLSILDRYAGNSALLEHCKSLFKELQYTRAELSTLTSKLERLAAERDYTQAQFEQLDAARLRSGELEELEAEQKQLANAEQIKENLAAVRSLWEQDGA